MTRVFGVLQAKRRSIAQTARYWTVKKIALSLRPCLTLHNPIVEERVKHDEDPDMFYCFFADSNGDNFNIVGNINKMCTSLNQDESISVVPPNTLAAVFDTRDYLNDELEYLRTR